MSLSHNHGASDRDMLIRLDADVGNLSNQVKEVRIAQTEQERAAQKLTENLNQLTYNVGAMVEGMKEAKEMMHTVGKHDQRIKTLEHWQSEHADDSNKVVAKIEESLIGIKNQLDADRKQWEPWVKLAGHWKWMLAGGIAIVGFVGWDTIKLILGAMASI